MQAKLKTLPIFLVGLVVSLLLGACGGGNTGSTWFNVPSVPVRLQEDGSASVYGFNLGQVVDPTVVQQLEAADVDKLDVRIGYEGIQPFLDGENLPYLNWDQASVAELQDIVRTTPNLPNAGLIAGSLPMLRQFGTGVALKLPNGESIPAWDGTEAVIVADDAAPVAVGPMEIGGLAFDDQGTASFAGVPLDTLGAGVALPPQVMGMLQQLGAERLSVDTSPSGIQLNLNDRPLPGITFDSESLDRMMGVAGAFVDEGAMETLNQVAPLLTSSDINLDLSFTGEPAGETQIGNIPVEIQPDGNLAVYGFPVSSEPILDAATLSQLQDANIQQLDVVVGENGLGLAANGMKLPSLSWNDDSLQTLAAVVGPLAGLSPELLDSALGIARNTGLSTSVSLPLAEGATPIEMPADIDFTYAAPDLGELNQPVVKLDATLNADGSIASAAGLDADTLAALGVSGPLVPANVMTALNGLGAQEIRIVGEPNNLMFYLDGAEALSVAHDEASLNEALNVATPFLGDTPLADPVVNDFLRNVILPLVPGANLDVTVTLQ